MFCVLIAHKQKKITICVKCYLNSYSYSKTAIFKEGFMKRYSPFLHLLGSIYINLYGNIYSDFSIISYGAPNKETCLNTSIRFLTAI